MVRDVWLSIYCLPVRPSHTGILSKRLNISHMIAQGVSFFDAKDFDMIPMGSPQLGRKRQTGR